MHERAGRRSPDAAEQSIVEPGVGQRVVPLFRLQNADRPLLDRRSLRAKKYAPLKKAIDEIHDKGSDVYGYFAAHQGYVLSVVTAAASVAGIVGIGVKVRRRRG
jgi:hypothetical protein